MVKFHDNVNQSFTVALCSIQRKIEAGMKVGLSWLSHQAFHRNSAEIAHVILFLLGSASYYYRFYHAVFHFKTPHRTRAG